MIETRQELAEEYSSALQQYLTGAGEVALQRAYELGRRAIADGLGVLEMAAIHQDSLAAARLSSMPPEERVQALERAATFFAESLSPFEMALRGFQEANRALRKNLEELWRTEDELRRQNEELTGARQTLEAERRRYQDLFDFAPDGYLATDPEGNIQEANRAAGTLLAVPPQNLVGASLPGFVSDKDRPAFQAQLNRLRGKNEKKAQELQVEMRSRTGVSFPALLSLRVVREASSRPVGLRWLLRDITERKRIEEDRAHFLVRELVARTEAEAGRRFAFLAEASALLVASLDCETTLANVARLVTTYMADWCSVYLVEQEGLLRRVALAHADPARADLARQLQSCQPFNSRVWQELGDTLGQGQPVLVPQVSDDWLESIASDPEHFRLVRQAGLLSMIIVPLHAHGRTLGAIALATAESGRRYDQHDVALAEDLARRCALAVETAQLYHAVTLERDKVAKASRAKDEFLAILGHELRNPLTPILGWVRRLKRQGLIMQDSVLKEGVVSLERNTLNILRLVDDCLDLVRISERKIRLEKERMDLNQVVEAAVEAIREKAQSKGLQLTLQPAPGSLWVLGDRARLEQVAINVLTNAVKYTVGGFISIRCSQIGKEAEIEFQDTGIGIAPEFLEQIFEPFRQGTNEWLRSESGLGLGLAIAREIVQMHEGRIWAQSPGPGQGSSFRLSLPLAGEQAEVPGPGLQVWEAPPTTSALRVLLIEDSKDIVELMRIELEALGYTVLTARDGEQGLEMARREVPDVIVSDIKMPGMDGYELLRRLREIPELASIPAIALTGLGMKEHMAAAAAAGYQSQVAKPVDAQELSVIIQKLVVG